MFPVIDWNLAWTIALGVAIGLWFSNVIASLCKMWEDNWKVTVLYVLSYVFPASILGAYLGYFSWLWLVPGIIGGAACYFVATDILIKEEEGDSCEY